MKEGRVTRFATLGRTGLRVSVVGLGCGGHSRLGQTSGATESDSVAVVERALDLGINFIDTAHAYRTERIVGKAIARKRHGVVIFTKVIPRATARVFGEQIALSRRWSTASSVWGPTTWTCSTSTA